VSVTEHFSKKSETKKTMIALLLSLVIASTALVPTADIVSLVTGSAFFVAGFPSPYVVSITVANSGLGTVDQEAVRANVIVNISTAVISGVSYSTPVGCLSLITLSDGHLCNLGVMLPASIATITLTVSVSAGAGLGSPLLSICADAESDVFDFLPENNLNCLQRTITASAQVDSSVLGISNRVAGGGSFPFSISFHNRGYSDMASVFLSYTFPDVFVVSPANLPSDCSLIGQTITCNLGTVIPGATVVRAFRAQISSSSSAATYEVCPEIQSSTTVVTGPLCSTLSIIDLDLVVSSTHFVTSGPIQAGGTDATFTVVALIQGTRNVTNPVVTIVLPSGLILSRRPSGCESASGVLTCALAVNTPGYSITFDGDVRALPDATAVAHVLCATFNSSESLPFQSQNVSCDSINVLRDYDLNLDGQINVEDMNVFQSLWNQCLTPEIVFEAKRVVRMREMRKRTNALTIACPFIYADRNV
jgi:hypothetical protein